MMVKAGTFPPAVRLGKCAFWSETAVSKWHQLAFLAQENWTPADRRISNLANNQKGSR
jgi:prophage regulatory protein